MHETLRGFSDTLLPCVVAVVICALASNAHAVTLNKPADIVCENDHNNTLTRMNVVWSDKSDGETGYEVYRSDDGGPFLKIADVAADAQSHTDSGLAANTVYRYQVRAVENANTGPMSDTCRRPALYDTPEGNFRLYYRPYAAADCPPREGNNSCVPAAVTATGKNETASRIGSILEGSRTAMMAVGFRDPALFQNGKPQPVNLIHCDGGGCAAGVGSGDGKEIYLGLEPDFLLRFNPATGANPESVIIPMHEEFHLEQYSYGGVGGEPKPNWVYEGQARSIQDKLCIGTNRATCLSLDSVAGGFASYVGEVNWYLGVPRYDLTLIDYGAALFWTYAFEQYGSLMQEPERGLDFLSTFWEQAAAAPGTGIETFDRTLVALGFDVRFPDVFSDFVVANYAKGLTGPSVPAKYKYVDEAQPPGPYDPVTIDLDIPLTAGTQVGPTLTDTESWSVRYYRFRPDATVASLQVQVSQDSANAIFYDLLAIRGGDLVSETRGAGPDFAATLQNDAYDEVILIVAGLGDYVNFRYSVNATQPVLAIVDPLTARTAAAGPSGNPGKVLVKASLLSPEGNPVEGLDTAAFTIRIGGLAVPEIVTSAFIQGQYWFLVQAPIQPADGAYEVKVEAMGLVATEAGAVVYGPRAAADTEIVLDRSGSMATDGKIAAAKNAALLYVDTWEPTDETGLVSFNDDESVDEQLDLLSTAHRDDMRATIGDVSAGGGTAIGDGLITGMQQLIDRGDDMDEWGIVLLSDGEETADRRISDFLDNYKARRDAGDKVPRVHAIALGPDADRRNMQRVAEETGGTYQFAALSTPAPLAAVTTAALSAAATEPSLLDNRLAAIYRVVSEQVAGSQQVFATTDGVPSTSTFPVDAGADELTAVVRVDANTFAVTLRDPNGTVVAPRRASVDRVFWRVPLPSPGTWTLEIVSDGCFEFDCPTEMVADAAVLSRLTMDVFLGLAPDDRLIGRPMPIVASLSDTGPIVGATVDVDVSSPSGAATTLTLVDDGEHGDGAPNDGFYGGVFRDTAEPGSYVAVVHAAGTSTALGPFERRVRLSFDMDPGTDGDGDGLPDWWEDRFGSNPNVPDADADDDGDGLSNGDEFTLGTHPHDADTDGGGERDGTDGDPFDPSDDRVSVPRAQAYPDVQQVILRYSTDPRYVSIRTERGNAPQGPFAVLVDGAAVTGELVDGAVVNDIQYCYRVTGIGPDGALSAASRPTCATPRADPVAPTGFVRIDGGAPVTYDLDVTLELVAIDNPRERETDLPGSPPPPNPRATTSGVAEMIVSNLPSFVGATWEPYAASKGWTLAPQTDVATVFVKYRDGAGNESPPLHASIRVVGHHPFQCYELDRAGTSRVTATVEVDDALSAAPVDVRRPTRVCNPADIGDDVVNGGTDVEALLGYEMRQARFAGRRGITVTNIFGTLELDLLRPDQLLVPSAIGTATPPSPPFAPTLNHYKCYRTHGARFRAPGLSVADDFGTLTVDVKRPYRLCVAADKEGEGIPDPASHLLCYRTRTSPRQQDFRGSIAILNQFDELELGITGPRELCVPTAIED